MSEPASPDNSASKPVCLSRWPAGVEGVLVDVRGETDLVRRLTELGLYPGVHLAVVTRGPWQGPVVVDVGPLRLALRQHEAECVWLKALAP